jgi:hypothetical protein
MMKKPPHTSRASLRTKTGCLTCRKRKKKCNEQRPKCLYCVTSQRTCVWPSVDLLIDGRNRARRASSQSSDAGRQKIRQPDDAKALVSTGSSMLAADFDIALRTLGSGLEVAIAHHFVDHYYPHLISFDCDPTFRLEWLSSIQKSMPQCTSLRYSVLANAASHIFLTGQCPQMQDLAIHYYTRSLRGLGTAISHLDTSNWQFAHNDILTSIIFLYLHGNMGSGTYSDISIHVNAAMRVLKRRFFQLGAGASSMRPTDRLLVESVIYQIFQVEMGYWSDGPGKGLAHQFDPGFWSGCERFLHGLSVSPESHDASISPVLGIPMVIYKLMLIIRRLWTMNPKSRDFEVFLSQVENQLSAWEGCELPAANSIESLFSRQPSMNEPSHSIVGHSTTIMVICASLLVHHLRTQPHSLRVPVPPDKECDKQVDKITAILRSRKGHHQWTSCHVGTYPVYVAGYLMRSEEEIMLVRAEMQQRFEDLHWRQVSRYWEDLETVWKTRSQSSPTARRFDSPLSDCLQTKIHPTPNCLRPD